MKMSDVFSLPVDEKRIELYGYDTVEPTSYQVAEAAAAHAINCHDELVRALNGLLASSIRMAGKDDFYEAQDLAKEALTRARGEA